MRNLGQSLLEDEAFFGDGQVDSAADELPC